MNYKCNIEVLSPIHIGSGDTYGNSEYLPIRYKNSDKTKKIFRRINISKFYSSLDSKNKDLFIDFLSDSDSNLMDFERNISKNFEKYACINECSKNPNNNQMIEETIKSLNKAYIPGSSIKGAIKTALLYNLFDDDSDKIRKFIKINNFRNFNSKSNEFVDSFFTSDIRKSSSQKDIMKFLHISDSTSSKEISVHDIYSIMASDKMGIKDNTVYKKYNKRLKKSFDVISFYETIDIGTVLEFNINNNYDSSFYSDLKLGDKSQIINVDNIKDCLYNFSEDLIVNELNFASEYNIDYLYDFYNKLEKRNVQDTPLLKIGAGSGFLATTLALKIKDNSVFDEIKRKKHGYDYCFPKSRKVTKRTFMPLGWVQLSLKEI